MTEYETQLAALQTELSQAHAQLEVQKQVLSEIALKGVRGSDNDESVNAVENLRRKMEVTIFSESYGSELIFLYLRYLIRMGFF